MIGDILYHPHTVDSIWALLIFIRNAVVGTVSVGLMIGACLFTHFLFRLSHLPKEMKYHLDSQTFLRYIITIFCLVTVNVLFYFFFDMGKQCSHIGAVVWIGYFIISRIRSRAKSAKK